MAKLKKTVKQSMKYWSVGWNGVVIKARTARVAVRKWLRDNVMYSNLIRDHELDNPHSSGEMPHETASYKDWAKSATKKYGGAKYNVEDVPVHEVAKGHHGPCAPDQGGFWSGFNK